MDVTYVWIGFTVQIQGFSARHVDLFRGGGGGGVDPDSYGCCTFLSLSLSPRTLFSQLRCLHLLRFRSRSTPGQPGNLLSHGGRLAWCLHVHTCPPCLYQVPTHVIEREHSNQSCNQLSSFYVEHTCSVSLRVGPNKTLSGTSACSLRDSLQLATPLTHHDPGRYPGQTWV